MTEHPVQGQQITPDEMELMTRIAAKDIESFNLFVSCYQQFVLSICHSIVNDKEEAEDSAQEVFLKVYQNADQFRGEASIKTWLYRIAVNTTLNLRRKRRFTLLADLFSQGKTNDCAELPSVVADDCRPDLLLEREERRKTIYRALDQLPEKQRTALILHKFECLSYKEIADLMGLSLSALESVIHRARKNLQKKLLKLMKL